MALIHFNANNVQPTSSFDPIPAGKYLAIITDSEMRTTKAGTGEYLELTFQILEDEHKGRLVWSRLNLQNPNPLAVEIAQGELSAICRAVDDPNDRAIPHESQRHRSRALCLCASQKRGRDADPDADREQ